MDVAEEKPRKASQEEVEETEAAALKSYGLPPQCFNPEDVSDGETDDDSTEERFLPGIVVEGC